MAVSELVTLLTSPPDRYINVSDSQLVLDNRTNYLPTPGFEAAQAGPVSIDAGTSGDVTGLTADLQSTDYKISGVGSGRFMANGVNSTTGQYYAIAFGPFTPNLGTLYTFSGYVFVPIGSPITGINIGIRDNTTFNYVSNTQSPLLVSVTPGQWTRISVSARGGDFQSGGAQSRQWLFSIADPEGNLSNSNWYLDNTMIEVGSTPGTYFDGTTINSAWTGTTQQSPSVTTSGFINLGVSTVPYLQDMSQIQESVSLLNTLNVSVSDSESIGESISAVIDPFLLTTYDVQYAFDGKVRQMNSQSASYGLWGTGAGNLEKLAQSFVAWGDTITSVELDIIKIGSPVDNMLVDIVSTLDGTSLGNVTIAASGVSAVGEIRTFTFSAPISVTRGNTYYIQLSRSGASSSVNHVNWQLSYSSPTLDYGDRYPFGVVLTRDASTWTDSGTVIDANFAVNFTGMQVVSMSSNFSINVSDSESISEAITITNTQLGGISVSDSETISETRTQVSTLASISVTDSETTSESVVITETQLGGINVSDSEAISESITITHPIPNISVTDSESIGETVTISQGTFVISVSDSESIGESITSVATLANISVSDSETVAESRTTVATLANISKTDSITITEYVRRKNPSPSTPSFGVNYKSLTNYATDIAYFRTQGITTVRINIPWYDTTPGSDWLVFLDLANIFYEAGFYVIYGMTGDISATYTWAQFASDAVAAATAAEGKCSEFNVGNELTSNNDDAYITDATLRSNLRSLATTVKGVFSGVVSYVTEAGLSTDTFGSYQWTQEGKGGFDKIGLNVYGIADNPFTNFYAAYHDFIPIFFKTFGTGAYISEFNLDGGNPVNFAGIPSDTQVYQMKWMEAYIRNWGITGHVLYTWRGYKDTNDDYAVKHTDNTLIPMWDVFAIANLNDPNYLFLSNGNTENVLITPYDTTPLKIGAATDYSIGMKVLFHPKTTTGNNDNHTIANCDLNYGSNLGYIFQIGASDGTLQVYVGNENFASSAGVFTYDTWQYVAFTLTGTTLKGYINGSLVWTQTITSRKATGATTNIWIGAESFGYREYYGYIKDFWAVKSLLNSTQITNITSGSYPTLDLHYQINEGISYAAIDTSGNSNFGLYNEPNWVIAPATATDSISIGESVTIAQGTTRVINVSDSQTNSELVTITNTQLGGRNVSDSETITESITSSASLANISVSDSEAIGEAITVTDVLANISVSDSESIAETIQKILTISVSVSDTESIGETITITNTQLGNIVVSDSEAIGESVTVSVGAAGAFSINTSDSISISEGSSGTFQTIYTTIGANTQSAGTGSGNANPVGLLVTLPTSGTISKITAYVNETISSGSLTAKLYNGSAGSLGSIIATSTTSTVGTTFSWVDFTFASPPSVSAGTYWIEFSGDGGGGPGTTVGQIKYDTGGTTNGGYIKNDFGVPAYDSNKYSIYATYSATGGISITISSPNTSVSDSISITESVSISQGAFSTNVSDSETISESITITHPIPNISVTDTESIGETVTITDSLAGNSITDSESIGEVITITNTQLGNIVVSDSESIGEAVTINVSSAGVLSISVSDSESIAESIGYKAISDSITTTESVTIASTQFVNVSDSESISESVSVTVTAASNTFSVSVSDSELITESIVSVATLANISVTDSESIGESIQNSLPIAISVSDSETITESISKQNNLFLSIIDQMAQNESLSLTHPLPNISISDILNGTESVSMTRVSSASVSESQQTREGITSRSYRYSPGRRIHGTVTTESITYGIAGNKLDRF